VLGTYGDHIEDLDLHFGCQDLEFKNLFENLNIVLLWVDRPYLALILMRMMSVYCMDLQVEPEWTDK